MRAVNHQFDTLLQENILNSCAGMFKGHQSMAAPDQCQLFKFLDQRFVIGLLSQVNRKETFKQVFEGFQRKGD